MRKMTEKRFNEISTICFENLLTDEDTEESLGVKKNALNQFQIHEFMKNTFWEGFCEGGLDFENEDLKSFESKKLFLIFG